MITSILLVGVGGQGTILAGKLLSKGLVTAGHDVKMSEIHGMAQRGGAVSTHVRYGERVDSPVIELGGADTLVAFEQMEAARWLGYLAKDGKLIVNDEKINSLPVSTGRVRYPERVLERLAGVADLTVVPATAMAVELGNAKVSNVILLGSLVEGMGLGGLDWPALIKAVVKPKFVDINTLAFEKGRESYRTVAAA